ncbi:MAG: GNAT family N-acetyltransferase [Vicinamibacterales bacterium]
MSSVVIRDVTVDDALQIVAILNPINAARCYTALDIQVSVEQERDFIRRFPARGIFLVAVDTTSNRIAGFQDVSPFADFTHAFDHVGVIGTYVDLELRRQGIATQLFAATFETARRKGYEKFFTYVRADNEAGLETYLKQGFRIVGTAQRHARIDGRYIDEIVIEKAIDLTDC